MEYCTLTFFPSQETKLFGNLWNSGMKKTDTSNVSFMTTTEKPNSYSKDFLCSYPLLPSERCPVFQILLILIR